MTRHLWRLPGVMTALFALMMMACPALAQGQQQATEFNGVRVEMEELAHDGNFPVPPDQTAASLKLDVNSTLSLRFVMPAADVAVQPSPEWVALDKALAQLNTLAEEFKRLSGLASRLETVDTAEWQEMNKRFTSALLEFMKILRGPDLKAIVSADEVKQATRQSRLQGKSMYGALSALLERKRKELIEQAQRQGADVASDTVSITAYVIPRSGEARQFHVPEYDNIDARPVTPVPRAGLIPDETELARLRQEYEGAKVVSKGIAELMEKRDEIDHEVRLLVEKLQQRGEQFVGDAKVIAEALERNGAEDLIQALQNAETEDARRFRDALSGLKDDIELIKVTSGQIEALTARFETRDPLDLVLAMKAASEDSAKLRDSLKSITSRLEAWPKHFETLASSGAKLASERVLEGRTELIEAARNLREDVRVEVRAAGANLVETLPDLSKAVFFVASETFAGKEGGGPSSAEDMVSAASAFDPDVKVREVSLKKAPDTRIDLRRSGIAVGDEVEIKLSFKSDDDSSRDRSITFVGEGVLTGWHRRYSGDVIFARAVSGPGSDTFKPNAAVSMEWHYFDREKPAGWWNRFDPGFGFHAANLDQDPDQAVELGAGVNMSLWNGLIRVAYGYNLSVEQDHSYFWVGFGLFGMLNRLNDLPGSRP